MSKAYRFNPKRFYLKTKTLNTKELSFDNLNVKVIPNLQEKVRSKTLDKKYAKKKKKKISKINHNKILELSYNIKKLFKNSKEENNPGIFASLNFYNLNKDNETKNIINFSEFFILNQNKNKSALLNFKENSKNIITKYTEFYNKSLCKQNQIILKKTRTKTDVTLGNIRNSINEKYNRSKTIDIEKKIKKIKIKKKLKNNPVLKNEKKIIYKRKNPLTPDKKSRFREFKIFTFNENGEKILLETKYKSKTNTPKLIKNNNNKNGKINQIPLVDDKNKKYLNNFNNDNTVSENNSKTNEFNNNFIPLNNTNELPAFKPIKRVNIENIIKKRNIKIDNSFKNVNIKKVNKLLNEDLNKL